MKIKYKIFSILDNYNMHIQYIIYKYIDQEIFTMWIQSLKYYSGKEIEEHWQFPATFVLP